MGDHAVLGDFGVEVIYRYLFPTLVYGALIAGVYFILYKAGNRFEKLTAYLLEDDGRRFSRLAFIVFAGVFLYGLYWIILHRYHPILTVNDASTMNQILYSATHGHLFSQSGQYALYGHPHVLPNFYYASSNAINLWWTPLLFCSWAYLLWPQSPMHIIIPYCFVMLFGGISFYYISRKITGSRAAAAFLLTVYALLPQLHLLAMTTLGVFDLYSVPFLMWTLYFLHSRKFLWFLVLAALTFYVSIFAQYIVIVLALAGFWLYRERRYLWLGAVFILLNLGTYAVFNAVKFCMFSVSLTSLHHLSGLFLKLDQEFALAFLGESITTLVYVVYICPLLLFAFSRNRFSMVLLAAIAPVFMMVSLRRAGHVENHHNHDIVVILFFLYAVYLRDGLGGKLSQIQARRLAAAQLVTYFAVPLILVVFPLGQYNTFMLNKQTAGVVDPNPPYTYNIQMNGGLHDVESAIDQVVPKDASLCVLTTLGNGAMFSNRDSIWFIQAQKTPRCQFYVLQNNINVFDNPIYNRNEIPVASLTQLWRNDLYTIYRNANPENLPYPHWVMGFEFLKNFGKKDCPQDTQSIVPNLQSP